MEATGASPGVAASRPHRSDPRAGPVRRTPCARGAWGGEPAGGWASDLPAVANCVAARGGEMSGSPDAGACWWHFLPAQLKKKGTRSLLRDASLEPVGMTPPKSIKSFLEAMDHRGAGCCIKRACRSRLLPLVLPSPLCPCPRSPFRPPLSIPPRHLSARPALGLPPLQCRKRIIMTPFNIRIHLGRDLALITATALQGNS